jgi:drug/metabolite transporter (DMT)-like permease
MKKGILFALITAVISGLSVFVNGIFVSNSDPLVFAIIRNALVAGIFSGLLLSGGMKPLKSLTKPEWLKLGIIGAVGGGIAFALFFTGLREIGAVNANLINKSLFLWVAVMAVPFLGEKVNWKTLAGYSLIFYATFFLGNTFSFIPRTGTFLVLAATLFWSVEYIISKKALKTIPVGIVAWGRMVFGLPFLLAAVFLTGKSSAIIPAVTLSATALWISAILLTGYMVSWYKALAKAPATIVTAILVVAPAVTLVIQTLMQHQAAAPGTAGSLVLNGMGVILVLVSVYRKITPVQP